jgi:hypothetical protein
MTSEPKKRGRKKVDVPDSKEFRAIQDIFRSKLRALQFMEDNKELPPEQLEALARAQMKQGRTKSIMRTAALDGAMAAVQTWDELVWFIRDLAKVGFPHSREDAESIGSSHVLTYPAAKGVVCEVQLVAMQWAQRKDEPEDAWKKRRLPMIHDILDRKVMDAIQTIAVRKNSRIVYLSEIIKFLVELGTNQSGGTNSTKLIRSLNRIANTSIRISFKGMEMNSNAFDEPRPLISRGNLPINAENIYDDSLSGDSPLPYGNEHEVRPTSQYFVELGEVYFVALTSKTPKNVVPELGMQHQERSHKGSAPIWYMRHFSVRASKGYDFAKWIWSRCMEAKTHGLPISFESIWVQLGKPDKGNFARWRGERVKQMAVIKSVWKDCSADVVQAPSGICLAVQPFVKGKYSATLEDTSIIEGELTTP